MINSNKDKLESFFERLKEEDEIMEELASSPDIKSLNISKPDREETKQEIKNYIDKI